MADNNRHLEHLVVKGFKSIKDLELDMKPINILIGANGSGKSNFISLFSFLRNLSEGKLQTYVEKRGFANSFFHFGAKTTQLITIDIDVGYNGYHVEFEHGASNDSLVFTNEYCTIKSSNRHFKIKGNKGESGLLPGSEADSSYVRKYTREYMEQCRVYHFHDTSDSAAFKNAVSVDASDYLYSNAGNLAAFLLRLKNSDDDEFTKSYLDIVSAIRTVAPYFHDFYLEPRGTEGQEKLLLKWLHREHDEPFSALQLSDGTARFICMATLFLQPASLRPRSIILDEPELGLHPAALEVLADLVKSVSSSSQVICSTQSVTFANQFEAKDFIVVDQEQGVSKFKRVDEEALKDWLEDYAMGDIWNKNLVGGRPEW
ncbi:AAA family ATPase [Paraneptunicella aestuarii]|uniref:AAA family ATPase n=1 Tax=Paraneptunicella aestuarii TaxID=2831148 RepID=UPI001E42D6D1|nr:AAA family ATPase [Paraneptunicella aestuarii]UAA40176.1 AAA family ATPase [Paraneptunicella aestuarii]